MKNYSTIEEATPRLRSEFNWYHSFIRELYLSTLHCHSRFKDDAGNSIIGDSQAPLDLRMIIAASGNAKIFGIEFLCFDVQMFSIESLNELRFECQLEKGAVILNFENPAMNDKKCRVRAKEVKVAFLGEEYLGPSLRVGHEIPREDAINSKMLDEYWRQCTNCSNAWVESFDIKYSRCPDCGQLTKLVR
jgi:hypothetical protein